MIDTSVPHIWLPRAACDAFEANFGLQYDNRTGFYTMNDTIHTRLQQLNPSFTFVLGNTNDPSKVLNIRIPYAALDLQASWPIFNKTTNYFPIRRAVNDTQYTLGRAFLQETYLITDYERSNFSLYQSHFQDGVAAPNQQIVPILSPSFQNMTETNNTTETNSRLTTPVIAGIAVGSLVSVAILLILLLLCLRKRSKMRSSTAQPNEDDHVNKEKPDVYEMFHEPPEVFGDKVQFEMESKASDKKGLEPGYGIEKMEADMIHELPTSRLSHAILTDRESIEKCDKFL
jgi:hypothetical protein